MNPATHGSEGSVSAPVLYAALELSNMTWRLALRDSAECQQDNRMIFHGWPPLGAGYDRSGAEIQRFRKRPENRWVQGAEGSNRPILLKNSVLTDVEKMLAVIGHAGRYVLGVHKQTPMTQCGPSQLLRK